MIYYKEGYKYQLVATYAVQTPITPDQEIQCEWYSLAASGLLTILSGYAWDGASGPTIDTKSSMRPSLIHDCLCQLMKERRLDYGRWHEQVHAYFEQLCREDGMGGFRASLWHWGVRVGQGGNPDDPDTVVVKTAP